MVLPINIFMTSTIQVNTVSVDSIEIPIEAQWTNIALSLSGGADSTLLAYLVCDLLVKNNLNATVHVINHVRMWKTRPWQSDIFQTVFDWLTHHFSSITFKLHTNFLAPDIEYGNIGPTIIDEYGKKVSGDNIQIRAFAEYICYNNNVEVHYNGTTRNPKDQNFGGLASRDIDSTVDNDYLRLMIHMNKLVSHPFRFVDKSWIVKQYKRLELMELFDLTRSCEGNFEGTDYLTYRPTQEVPTCGECFWCKERAWALTQNGF